jgi:hypothetical protein
VDGSGGGAGDGGAGSSGIVSAGASVAGAVDVSRDGAVSAHWPAAPRIDTVAAVVRRRAGWKSAAEVAGPPAPEIPLVAGLTVLAKAGKEAPADEASTATGMLASATTDKKWLNPRLTPQWSVRKRRRGYGRRFRCVRPARACRPREAAFERSENVAAAAAIVSRRIELQSVQRKHQRWLLQVADSLPTVSVLGCNGVAVRVAIGFPAAPAGMSRAKTAGSVQDHP